ncbi:MAG TPA: hypothetical protein VLB87_04310 [Pyrinomonadaceae bacterium]|nr:hypothetical protein [Pyrinomonadaceae bacterium]
MLKRPGKPTGGQEYNRFNEPLSPRSFLDLMGRISAGICLTPFNLQQYGLTRRPFSSVYIDFSPEPTRPGRYRPVAQPFLRCPVSLFIACLFIASLGPGIQVTSADLPNGDSRFAQRGNGTDKRNASPKYDCVGNLPSSPIAGNENVEQAIDDALELLNTCATCRRMFGKDPNYASKLLKKLRREGVIVISEFVPVRSRLSTDGKHLKVYASLQLKDAAAVRDLVDSKSRAMVKPCIYINPNEFIVTGKRAENYAMYGLRPPLQRAVAILHELGHVTGALGEDGEDTAQMRKRSTANTSCVRENCVSCKIYPCPVFPKRPRKAQK